MAKKKTKKKLKKDPITGKYPTKRRNLRDVQKDLQKSGVYSNKKMKERAKKAIKYAKENPYEVALGAAMMHPGVRLGAGIAKVGRAAYKGVKALGKKKISGAPVRQAFGTKVKGQGKTYKTRAQAEVAAGGTKKMKGATIDKTKGGYQVNPSRKNVMKSPKTFAVGAGLTAAAVSKKNKKSAPKPKAKVKAKGNGSKRKTYKSVESAQGKKVQSQSKGRRNTAGANAISTSKRRSYGGKTMDTQSGKMSTSRNVRGVIKRSGALVKKKKRKDVAGSGARAFRRRLGGQRVY